MSKKVLTHNLYEPLCGATIMKVEINPGDGNLIIDGFTGGEPVLASGALQYLENHGQPSSVVDTSRVPATYALKASGKGQPWFHFPWAACNGATEWQVHLNPNVSFDITAHSDGGNIKLDLSEMDITRVSADTGGGNMEVILPENSAGLSAVIKTGAGNVDVHIPAGIAARIHATSGLGKVIMAPGYIKVDANTYQSPDYDSATDKVEITASSGAGNVSVKERLTHLAAVTNPI